MGKDQEMSSGCIETWVCCMDASANRTTLTTQSKGRFGREMERQGKIKGRLNEREDDFRQVCICGCRVCESGDVCVCVCVYTSCVTQRGGVQMERGAQ